jgi:hypothetical protein
MRTWTLLGMIAFSIYVVMMFLAFLIDPDLFTDPYQWDLGEVIPLVAINIPGLALYHFIEKVLGTGIEDPGVWIITILSLNVILYPAIGSLIGLFGEKIVKKESNSP